MKQDLYTIQEVSSLLGVSSKTLRRWEDTGLIKPIRTLGNQRRYRLEDIKRLERRRRLHRSWHESRISAKAAPAPEVPVLKTADRIAVYTPVTPQKKSLEVRQFIIPLAGALTAFVVLIGGALLWQTFNYHNLSFSKNGFFVQKPVGFSGQAVLGESISSPLYQLAVNIPSVFGQKATFLNGVQIKNSLKGSGLALLSGGINTNNADVNAGTGKLTASNVIYSLIAGSNITISGNSQYPVISASSSANVASVQGATGTVNFSSGSGISLNGLQISNSGVLSLGGATGTVSLAAGNGIAVSGTTITNTDTGSAQNIFKNFTIGSTTIAASSNNDTINFAAGSGIALTGNAGTKTITITSNASGTLSGLTTNGILYGTSATNATSTAPGTTGTVLHGITNGAPVFSAVNLTSDVTGVLPQANGGTGINTTPTAGQILIGDGSGYQLGTITAGSGIGVINGSGTITLSNNGVLSLTGTANEVNVSAVTGAVTLSLPQAIAATSVPSFSALNLTATTNELVLGTGNTATITTASLTSGQTYTFPNASGTVCLTTGNCAGAGGGITGSGTAGQIAFFNGSSSITSETTGFSWDTTTKSLGIGTDTPTGKLSVFGAAVGKALGIFNETGDQNILTASASGVTEFAFNRNGDLQFTGGSGYLQTLTSTAASGQTYNFPTFTGSSADVCLDTGNCSGVGGIIGGSGTLDYIPKFTPDGSHIGDSLLYDTGTSVGVNTTSPVGLFDVNGAVAGQALAVLNYTGTDQNILVGSASGATKFFFDNSGNLNLLTGSYELGGNTVLTSTSLGSGILNSSLTSVGTITSGAWHGSLIGTQYGGTGQDFSATTTGSLPYFSGNGVMGTLAAASNGDILTLSGGVPTWENASGTLNFWQRNSGALSPLNMSDDLLLGGTSTASAKFAFINNVGGTPTASISANSGNNATYLTGAGVLGTTNKQSLTLGSVTTGNIVLSSNGNIILNSFGAGVVHTSATGALSTGLVQNSELQNSTITVNGGTGLGVSGSPVALGGTLTLSNTGVTSALAGSGISLSGATGAVTITNAGVTSLNAGTGALTLANSSLTGSTITINNATATTEGIASFNSTNFSISSGAVNTIQNINTSASPTFSGITLSGLTSGQFVKTTTGGQLTTSQYVNLTSDVTGILPVANGGTNTTAVPTAGAIAYGTGSAYGFSAAGTAGQVLESGGTGSPTWVSAASVGTNYWQLNANALSPANSTYDLLLGGTATTSAKFAFINNAGGTPTASISGNLSLAVPTGANPAALFNVFNGGSLNFQTSVGGDGGLSSRLYIANNGNVGIGTTNPSYPLDVNGDITSETGNYRSSGALVLNPSGTTDTASLGTVISGSNDIALTMGQTMIWDNVANGYTGITARNNQILTLNGTQWSMRGGTSNAHSLTLGATINNSLQSITSSDELDIIAGTALKLGSGGTNQNITLTPSGTGYTILNGNVGIGTTAPVAPLQVNGSYGGNAAAIINQLNSGDILDASASGTTKFAINNNGNLQFYGNSGYLNTISTTGLFSSAQTYNLPNTGGTFCLSTNNCGFASGTNYWQLNANALSPANSTYDFLLGGTATTSAKFAFINNAGGTPTASISGNLSLAVPTGANPADTFNILNGGSLNFQTSVGGDGGLSSRLYIANNGNVGIGTNAPTQLLDIQGNVNGNIPIRMMNNASASTSNSLSIEQDLQSSTQSRVVFKILSAFNNTTDTTRNSFVQFLTAQNGTYLTAMTINGGNIGIGSTFSTTTPTALLDVAGTASVSGELALNTTPQIQSTAMQTLTLGGTTTGDIAFQPGGVSAGSSLYLASSGNVGIGTNTPLAQLEINGNSGNTPGILLSNSSRDIAYSTGEDLKIGNYNVANGNWTQRAVFDSLGNFGITASTPLAPLDVEGAYGGNAAAIINQLNSGDIFDASSSGATKFTIANNGNITAAGSVNGLTVSSGIISSGTWNGTAIGTQYGGTGQNFASVAQGAIPYFSGTGVMNTLSEGASGYCLVAGVSTPGWASCGATGIWGQGSGAIFEGNTTEDLLLGGTATSSAKFSFIGNAGTSTPVASIAATPSSGTTTGLSLSGTGTIQSLNNNTLTIGGNTTGNIAFEPGGSLSNFILSSNGTAQMTSTGGRILELGVSDAAPYANIGTVSNNTFQIITNNTQVAAFSTNGGFAIGKTYSSNTPPANGLLVQGNVGIGTTSPARALEIDSSTIPLYLNMTNTTGEDGILFANSGTNTGEVGLANSAGQISSNSSAGDLVLKSISKNIDFAAGAATDMELLQNGDLGIGTTSPVNKLDVNGGVAVGTYAGNTAAPTNGILASGNLIVGTNSTSTAYADITNAGGSKTFLHVWDTSPNSDTLLQLEGASTISSGTDFIKAVVDGRGAVFWVDGTGKVVSTVGFNGECLSSASNAFSTNTTKNCNMDVAEIYHATENVASGDLVVIDPTSTDSAVMKSTTPYASNMMGIVTTSPGIILGLNGSQVMMGGETTTYMQHANPRLPAIALDGKVPLKVSTSNGPIEPGDPLTSSSIPGVAMKATQPGPIIGKALESYSNSDPNVVGTVLTFVNISWYDPSVYLTNTGNLSISAEASPSADPLLVQYSVKDANGQPVQQVGVFSNAVVGNLKAGSIDTQSLILAGQSVSDRLNTLENAASSSAQLGSKVDTLSSSLASLQDRVASLEGTLNLLASGSALLNSPFAASSASQLGLDTMTANDAVVNNALTVLGRTTVADLGVTGRVTIGLLGINGLDQNQGAGQAFASINTSAGPLMIQSEGLNGVDFLNGKLTINTNGDLTTQGIITASKLNIDTPDVAAASLGTATLPAGYTSVVINTTAVSSQSAIFVTPKTKTSEPLSVTQQTSGKSFKVEVTAPAVSDIKFNWWVIN